MKKILRVFIIIDQGMIWEAYSDMPIDLYIQNNDKEWCRKLHVVKDGGKLDHIEDVIAAITEESLELPGLKDEEKKHILVKPKRK